MPQGNGDLGRRMQLLFQRLPPGPAIIVGSDIPAINTTEIAKAFRFLGNANAVFGRAPDGGYWLVGLRRSPRVLAPFAQVRWSGPHALADTLNNLKGQRVAFAATLSDVDTEKDYRCLRRYWERLIPPAGELRAKSGLGLRPRLSLEVRHDFDETAGAMAVVELQFEDAVPAVLAGPRRSRQAER